MEVIYHPVEQQENRGLLAQHPASDLEFDHIFNIVRLIWDTISTYITQSLLK